MDEQQEVQLNSADEQLATDCLMENRKAERVRPASLSCVLTSHCPSLSLSLCFSVFSRWRCSRLNFVDEQQVVQLKGQVACEMNSANELLSTECLMDNQLEQLTAAEAVALLSAFVFVRQLPNSLPRWQLHETGKHGDRCVSR